MFSIPPPLSGYFRYSSTSIENPQANLGGRKLSRTPSFMHEVALGQREEPQRRPSVLRKLKAYVLGGGLQRGPSLAKPWESQNVVQDLIKATQTSGTQKLPLALENEPALKATLAGLQVIQKSPFRLLSQRAGEVRAQIETRSAAYLQDAEPKNKADLLTALASARELADINTLYTISNWSEKRLSNTFRKLNNEGYL